MDLHRLASSVRAHPGLQGKRILAAVASALGGDGDDAAILDEGADASLVLAAEAIVPGLLAAQPRVAGAAGVVTVLNDLAATGARPLAILDTVAAGSEALITEALEGLRGAAALYGVPVVGGHTTLAPGDPSLATFAVGRAVAPLRAAGARPGDALCLAVCLEGTPVEGPGGLSFFTHLRGPRRERAGEDLALVPEAAEAGEAWAARDVSMPGAAGSLLQLMESAGGLGCALRVDLLPRPAEVPLGRWLVTFPSYGFLLVGDPVALAARFGAAGLVCAEVGTLDASGRLRLADGREEAELWDLAAEPLTGLTPTTT
jgi:selenophosphate synthetase-related protein